MNEPNWRRIDQDACWLEEVLPWLTAVRDHQRRKAEEAETEEKRFEFCMRARQLTELLDFPKAMIEAERLEKQMENEDAGRRERDQRDRYNAIQRAIGYRR